MSISHLSLHNVIEGLGPSVQMLAPTKNYLYRGSNARKTVRELLDARHNGDAALLYEAITKKKFDVPVTR